MFTLRKTMACSNGVRHIQFPPLLGAVIGLLWLGCTQLPHPDESNKVANNSYAAAERGDAKAQFELGYAYWERKDYANALTWYRKAAEQGHAIAQLNLGVLYANGQGVAQNYDEALKLYQSAADQGLAQAQYNLGRMYERGLGVPARQATDTLGRVTIVARDLVRAHMWHNLAAAQGHEEAAAARDDLRRQMNPFEIKEAQRLASEWQAKTISE